MFEECHTDDRVPWPLPQMFNLRHLVASNSKASLKKQTIQNQPHESQTRDWLFQQMSNGFRVLLWTP